MFQIAPEESQQQPRDLHQVGGQGGRGGDLHRVGQHLLCGVYLQGGGGVAGQGRGGEVADQLQVHQQEGGP